MSQPLLGLLASRRSVAAEPVTCPVCLVHYRPALTRDACPVCDADAPGAPDSSAARAWGDPDTRVVAIVVMATILNLILLSVLVIVASHG